MKTKTGYVVGQPAEWDRARLSKRFGQGPDLSRGVEIGTLEPTGPMTRTTSGLGAVRRGVTAQGSRSPRPVAGPRYAYTGPLTWRAAWRWFIRPYLFALLCIAVIVSGLLILALW